MSSQGFKKGLLIKIFCTGVPPCLQRGDYQGAISSYQGTIKQVWVSAERNFISDLNQFQMMANAGKVNLYHMTKFHISIDSLSSCFKAVLSTRIDFSSFYLLNIYSSNYQPESDVCRFSLKRDSNSLCSAGVLPACRRLLFPCCNETSARRLLGWGISVKYSRSGLYASLDREENKDR